MRKAAVKIQKIPATSDFTHDPCFYIISRDLARTQLAVNNKIPCGILQFVCRQPKVLFD